MNIHMNRAKNAPTDKKLTDEYVRHALLSSLLGILACALCLVGLTMAWFTSTLETGTVRFSTTSFAASKSVTNLSTGAEVPITDGLYELEAGTKYTVTVTPDDTFGQGNGYLMLTAIYGAEKITYYSEMIVYDGGYTAFTFTVAPETDVKISLADGWGVSGKDVDIESGKELALTAPAAVGEDKAEGSDVNSGNSSAQPDNVPGENGGSSESGADSGNNGNASDTENNGTPADTNGEAGEHGAPSTEDELNSDGTYTVKRGETLYEIAERFDTTVSKLAAYNGISNPNLIRSGDRLKIPPSDYEVPKAPAETERQPDETTAPVTDTGKNTVEQEQPAEPDETTPETEEPEQPGGVTEPEESGEPVEPEEPEQPGEPEAPATGNDPGEDETEPAPDTTPGE